MKQEFEEPVKILFHLNEGFTKVILERTIGVGMADGGIEWDIPTEKIPRNLRKIGSRFILVGNYQNSSSMKVKTTS